MFVFRNLLAYTILASVCSSAATQSDIKGATQDAVNWYRFWYGEQHSLVSTRTVSEAWMVNIATRAYVVLPALQLAVTLSTGEQSVQVMHVEEVPSGQTGQQSVATYLAQLRRAATLEAGGRADRFDAGPVGSDQILEALDQNQTEIVNLGVLSLPLRRASTVAQTEQSRFSEWLERVSRDDVGLRACSVRQLVVPRFGSKDPVVFVLAEAKSSDCGVLLVFCSRSGSGWRYEVRTGRGGDLDDLARKIRERVALTISVRNE